MSDYYCINIISNLGSIPLQTLSNASSVLSSRLRVSQLKSVSDVMWVTERHVNEFKNS